MAVHLAYMGLGSTAKKLQKVADTAEELYARLNDLRDQVREMQNTVGETHERVDRLETENAEQRAILEALAEERGVDVESVTADVDPAERPESDATEAETPVADAGDGEASSDASGR